VQAWTLFNSSLCRRRNSVYSLNSRPKLRNANTFAMFLIVGVKSCDYFLSRAQIAGRIFNPDPDSSPWTRTRTAIVYSTRAPYENRLIKICRNWLEMKLSNFYLCFHALDINTLHRFVWVLTLFIKRWKHYFTFNTCVLYSIVSRAVRVQGWPGLKLSCDLGSGSKFKSISCSWPWLNWCAVCHGYKKANI
jgi:hypothetical protein